MKTVINQLRSRYENMKSRCYNSKNKHYEYYGGKGIKICNEWLDNKNNFIIWALTHGYEEHLTIERHDGEKNYDPTNCRWVTRKVQAENRVYKVHNKQFKGVRFDKRSGHFQAQIQHDNKKVSLGTFISAKEGAIAFNNYVIKHSLNRGLNDLELFEDQRDIDECRTQNTSN